MTMSCMVSFPSAISVSEKPAFSILAWRSLLSSSRVAYMSSVILLSKFFRNLESTFSGLSSR